jgi:hypothetical protein
METVQFIRIDGTVDDIPVTTVQELQSTIAEELLIHGATLLCAVHTLLLSGVIVADSGTVVALH